MKFIILFEDSPAADPDVRQRHVPAHLAFLEAHCEAIEAAGPLSKPSGENAGGVWIVNAANEGEAEQLVREDPFWPTGLRKSFSILRWSQVYANGTRLMHRQ